MDAQLVVYSALSFSAIVPLILLLVPYLLPERMFSNPPKARLSAPALSLVGATILHCLFVAFDLVLASKGINNHPELANCSAIFNVVFLTLIVSHLPVMAMTIKYSFENPGKSIPSPYSSIAQAFCYLYALWPVTALVILAAKGNILDNLGIWWGVYCIPRLPSWQYIRLGSLLAPIMLSVLLISYTLLASLTRPKAASPPLAEWVKVCCLLLVSLMGMVYLICETTMGWKPDWWPRVLEGLIGFIVCAITVNRATIDFYTALLHPATKADRRRSIASTETRRGLFSDEEAGSRLSRVSSVSAHSERSNMPPMRHHLRMYYPSIPIDPIPTRPERIWTPSEHSRPSDGTSVTESLEMPPYDGVEYRASTHTFGHGVLKPLSSRSVKSAGSKSSTSTGTIRAIPEERGPRESLATIQTGTQLTDGTGTTVWSSPVQFGRGSYPASSDGSLSSASTTTATFERARITSMEYARPISYEHARQGSTSTVRQASIETVRGTETARLHEETSSESGSGYRYARGDVPKRSLGEGWV